MLALAPDGSSQRSARGLAKPSSWQDVGQDEATASVWGACRGSGAKPYQTCVDLTGPAYRCSCPSRKFPCKHTLALLMLWAAGEVAAGQPPEWVRQWQAGRQQRTSRSADKPRAAPSEVTQRRRAARVEAGLDELDRWLTDQLRQGLAAARRASHAHWDEMAARLVDAQAPGAATAVRRLYHAAADPERLLAGLALLRLLVAGYRRREQLPTELVATVRTRIGFPVATEEVLAGPAVRDEWQVIGAREEDLDSTLTVRRTWLLGRGQRRPALVLSFAPAGQSPSVELVPGTVLDADLHFHPGALPLRAVPGKTYAPVWSAAPEGAGSVREALSGHADAVARDPWLEQWSMLLLAAPVFHERRWWLRDQAGDGLPLEPGAAEPWPLLAGAGGTPVPVAGEWSPGGFRPLAAWVDDRMVRL